MSRHTVSERASRRAFFGVLAAGLYLIVQAARQAVGLA